MVLLEPFAQVIVAASAIIGAAAAVGIYRRIDQLVTMVEKHERTLYGADSVESWDGLVARVADHEAELADKRDEQE